MFIKKDQSDLKNYKGDHSREIIICVGKNSLWSNWLKEVQSIDAKMFLSDPNKVIFYFYIIIIKLFY